MVKEITVHKAMIAFRMLFRQANVFIHVKGDDVLEANLACFMHFNQRLVGGQREYHRLADPGRTDGPRLV